MTPLKEGGAQLAAKRERTTFRIKYACLVLRSSRRYDGVETLSWQNSKAQATQRDLLLTTKTDDSPSLAPRGSLRHHFCTMFENFQEVNMVAKLWQALTIGEAMCVPRHPLCMLQNGDAGNEAIHSSCNLRKRNPDEELSRSIVQHAWIVWRRMNLISKGSVQKAAQGGKISDRTQRNARTQSHVQTLLCKRWRKKIVVTSDHAEVAERVG